MTKPNRRFIPTAIVLTGLVATVALSCNNNPPPPDEKMSSGDTVLKVPVDTPRMSTDTLKATTIDTSGRGTLNPPPPKN